MPETAIIIRTRNEARWIGEVLQRLGAQTYQDFEIIIVDSGSTDETLTIASQFPTQIVHIAPNEFTYPYAINLGIRHAQASRYYCVLSAHSLPGSTTWLASGIEKFNLADSILGVYGPQKALPDGTLSDKAFYALGYVQRARASGEKRYREVHTPGMGVLGFTNALIRKDLWEQYPINEDFAGGGEDGDWASHWMSKGYIAIDDMDFFVLHSHYLGPLEYLRQLKHWRDTAHPSDFQHLSYRRDPAHASIDDTADTKKKGDA